MGSETIEIVCTKVKSLHTNELANGGPDALATSPRPPLLFPSLLQASVSKLFKKLFIQQRTLGIKLIDVKSHVMLSPMSLLELQAACTLAITEGLVDNGWWQLEGDATGARLLGTAPLATVDGIAHVTECIVMQVCLQPPSSLVLLVSASTVRYRHLVPSGKPPGEIEGACKSATGSFCRIIPTLSPGIVTGTRQPSKEEETGLLALWASMGQPLGPSQVATVVDVRFDEDEDATSFPFPPCAVLSSLGLDEVHTRIHSPEVQGALLRLQGKQCCRAARGLLPVLFL